MEKRYVFAIRPSADSSGSLPESWRLHGALGPVAILEASSHGLRIVQRSPQALVAQIVVGSAVGIAIMLGVFVPVAFVIINMLGLTVSSAILGYTTAGATAIGVAALLGPYVRNLVAWRPRGRPIQVQVLSASFGSIHHELHIYGGGQEALVRMSASFGRLTHALRLAREMPSEAEGSR